MDKYKKIQLIALIVLVAFTISVLTYYILGYYLKLEYPFNTFLMPRAIAVSDFYQIIQKMNGLDPYFKIDYWMNYFPFGYILFFPFSLIKNMYISYYLVFVGIFILFFIINNWKYFFDNTLSNFENIQNIFILTFLTYPFLFLIDRGNIDMLLFIIFAIAITGYHKQKYILSCIMLAFLCATKPVFCFFPIIFLIDKKYKEFFYTVILAVIFFIAGMLILDGTFFHNLNVLYNNLILAKDTYLDVNTNMGMGHYSSLFLSLKAVGIKLFEQPLISIKTLDFIYNILNIVVLGIVIWASCREQIFWKKINFLILYTLSMPFIVVDYKFIFIFIPLWFFVNYKEKTPFDLIYSILFALLLIPKEIIIKNLNDGYNAITLGLIINPYIILLFMVIMIIEQFKKAKQ